MEIPVAACRVRAAFLNSGGGDMFPIDTLPPELEDLADNETYLRQLEYGVYV